MKLYKTPFAAPGERWHSSKAGLKGPEELETPKDGRQGMADFLNANEREVAGITDELEQAEARAVAAARLRSHPLAAQGRGTTVSSDAKDREWAANDIEDFIVNRATGTQVERIFASFGVRFKELTHGG